MNMTRVNYLTVLPSQNLAKLGGTLLKHCTYFYVIFLYYILQ